MAEKEKKQIATGIVTEIFRGPLFKVVLDEDGREVIADLRGKMRLHRIRVTVGEKVEMELNPYDEKKAYIIKRL